MSEKKEVKTRIYVTTIAGEPSRLIRATSQAAVRDHLTANVEITMASAEDVVDAMQAGIKIEEAAASE